MAVSVSLNKLTKRLGPGVITGAADDDPSGIATYSQAGAQQGVGLLWTVVLTWPMMVAVQSVSARIGRVTGHGLAANMLAVFPRPVVTALVGLLFIANTINIGADLSAMGAAAKLVLGGNQHLYTLAIALITLLSVVYVPYHRYVDVLKWLTFSLFAYVGVVFTVHIDWGAVALGAVLPTFDLTGDSFMLIVAVFGTTISPYLFFWQSSQEVEEEEADPEAAPLIDRPEQASRELNRIGWETWLGMAASNIVAFFIILTTAVTLHAHGQTDIQTSEQAAIALRPIAGDAAFLLFSLGIIGTGLLAVPVLAGSTAYALGEARNWRIGLEHKLGEAKGFYATIAVSIVLGVGVDISPLDPIKALVWSAVVNGVITVPILVAMMIVASDKRQMGRFVATHMQRLFGWLATAMMAVAAVAMFVTM
ncbi:NRAMP (natural resistance-associated macrophage protein) metal ion transporters [Enhydrobacter aerosaccus]|uniref:NRAMP (Natural resistance-associated macrophage protein) metal ion transporters n=1 Tax=Enhydrobacter aerosaccus TaxID=225324 RepID=A0A1T4JUV8_9HYPH|nr:divalent metal cation transporter [Enhydrobacter aerosaccus]SJZ34012.1 NRAMP (natural resistance-associated macrophage protein) metal ion transporters [Enhydrobacter aerosaccus]